jgi:hypothetical protein
MARAERESIKRLGQANRPFFRPESVGDCDPLRLEVAAAYAFPDGSMSASGLRREAARGRLMIERIAGKDYTTLGAIKEMRERCRSVAKGPACGSSQPMDAIPPFGLSEMANTNDALASVRSKLKKLSAL